MSEAEDSPYMYLFDMNDNAASFATPCWPSQASTWWNQPTTGTVITSLGPFQCPEAYTVAWSQQVGLSALSACCPSLVFRSFKDMTRDESLTREL